MMLCGWTADDQLPSFDASLTCEEC